MASYRTVTVTATIASNTVTANGEVSEHIFTADADGQQVIVTDPYVAVETVEEGVLLTVRDAHEETQAVIYNGQKGDKGDKGNPGVDGFSPIATVTKSGDVATISITDKNGTTTATVKDGADGASDWNDITGKPTFATVATSGSYNDLSNKPTIPSAVTESTVAGWGFTKNTGTYSKPSGGIPKTDLASVVQTSLGKADTALQSFTESDPTVPSWAKASSKPSYTKSEVGLGNVDNVKQYSASNPPPYPVTSVNGSTGAVTVSVPTKVSDLTNDSGFITGMTILSYGNSTWADFEAAYNANKIVYCRASSNANPASGSQTRLAFMAYVNNAATPTSVEFQYYRSVSSHTASQQGDQVFVYKLDKTSGWSVTVREAYTKIVAGTGLNSSYANGTLSLTCDTTGLQTTSNLVTSISSSSTDAQYPSAKCVYDAIANAGGGGGGSANILLLYTNGVSTSDPVYIDSAKTTTFADYYDNDIDAMGAALNSVDLIYVYTTYATRMYTKYLINKIVYDSNDETLIIRADNSNSWYLI